MLSDWTCISPSTSLDLPTHSPGFAALIGTDIGQPDPSLSSSITSVGETSKRESADDGVGILWCSDSNSRLTKRGKSVNSCINSTFDGAGE